MRESEGLGAETALKCFDAGVDVVVALERELGGELLATTLELTFEHLLFLHE